MAIHREAPKGQPIQTQGQIGVEVVFDWKKSTTTSTPSRHSTHPESVDSSFRVTRFVAGAVVARVRQRAASDQKHFEGIVLEVVL